MPAKRTMLLCGDTKDGKTTQLALMAKWAYERFKLKSKLIVADGGGSNMFDDMGLIDEGIVDVFDMTQSNYPIAHLARISRGFWPNPDGEFVSGEGCKVDFSTQPDGTRFGLYLFDGITGMAELLGTHATNPGSKVGISSDGKGFRLGTISEEDGYQYGTLDKPHYNIVHMQLKGAFSQQFKSLPLDFFCCTARWDKQEGFNRQSKYFPKTMGNAIASDIPSWFNDQFALATQVVMGDTIKRQLKLEVASDMAEELKVAWFKPHKDTNTGIEYTAGFRIATQGLNYVARDYPEGYQILDFEKGITRFYEYLEKVSAAVRVKTKKDLDKSSGVVAG